MSKIVRSVANLLLLFILVFGLYTIMHGHDLPGGGFQGGAIIASGIAMLVVAYGSSRIMRYLRVSNLVVLACCSALAFAAIAFAGLGTSFFYNFLLGTPIFGGIPPTGPGHGHIWSGGIIVPMEFTIGFVVSAGLSAIVIAMAAFTSNKGEETEE